MRYTGGMSETTPTAFNPFDRSARLSANRSLVENAILELLEKNPGGMTGDAIARSVRVRRSIVYSLFREMWEKGYIVGKPHPTHSFGIVWKRSGDIVEDLPDAAGAPDAGGLVVDQLLLKHPV